MTERDDEEALLREVALQNAKSIFLARQRAEEELVRTKDALEKKSIELANSLAMVRATLESTTDGILVTDDAGTVTGFNDQFATMWRLPPEVMDTRDHRQVREVTSRNASDPSGFLSRIEEVYATSPPQSYDLLELVDGRVFERFSRIQIVDGRNVGRVWSFRDITEQKRAEEALRQSESQFRQLSDAMPQMVWTARPDGRIDYYNERWYDFTGFARDDFGDQTWKSILFPDDLARHVETYAESMRLGGFYQNECRLRDSSTGGYRWFLCRAFPLRDKQGNILRWFGTCTDIHQTKQAEETTRFLADASAALAELTDYESTLQKVASLAVPFFADWCFVDMQESDGSLRRLAVTHTDPAKVKLVQETFRRYPPQPTDPRGVMNVLRTGKSEWMSMIPEALLQESARDEDHLGLIRRLRPKSYICTPVRSRGRTLGVLTFVTEENGRVYDAIDLAVAEDLAHRTAIAVENANLLEALKDSDRRKDEFLAMLAHELRNPLAPIRNAIQIIREKAPDTPELQWSAEVIDRQVHQMTRLVDDLLDVSRITRGKIELRKERIPLADVVNSAVEASRPLIEKSGHELRVSMPEGPIYLDADPIRLAQVLLNLLNNAAKYTDPGGRIELTVEKSGHHVLIRVKDTGVGISREMLPRIFDLFTQVDHTLERSEGGLGIGLTLVRRLVEMHSGFVEVRSEGLGKGSEFIVRLPLSLGDVAQEPQKTPTAMKRAGPPRARILVVDDNRDAADTLGMLLSMMGHEVHTAHDGIEAVAATERLRPDIVLLDIGLPRLNGYEAARRIRMQSGGANIVLVALTGWGQEEHRERSREAGFDRHMTKPVEFEDLERLLADIHPGDALDRPS